VHEASAKGPRLYLHPTSATSSLRVGDGFVRLGNLTAWCGTGLLCGRHIDGDCRVLLLGLELLVVSRST
jgi:hypothetical protein